MEKRRNRAESRARLIAAAQQAFAERGYNAASTRDLATSADVNIALIARYFGSKQGLYREALAALLEVSPLVSGPRDAFAGEVFKQVSDGNTKAVPSTRILALSIGDESSRQIAAELLKANSVEPLAAWLGGEDARAVAELVLALTLGVTAYRILFAEDRDFLASARVQRLFRAWLDQAAAEELKEAATTPR